MVYCIPAWICRGGGIYLQCTEKCTISSLALHSSMISSFQPTFTIEDQNSNSIMWPQCFITKFIYPNYHMLKSLTILKNHSLGSLQWLRWEITVVLHNPLLDVQLHLITQGGPTRTQPLYRPYTVGEINFHFLYVRWQNFLFSTKW